MNIDYKRLLQGYYEAERLPKNPEGIRHVPDYAFNVLNPFGLLYKPVVDIERLASGTPRPIWPEGRPFAVCLTHDVDAVTEYTFRQSARLRRSQFQSERAWAKKTAIFLGHGTDMLRSLRQGGRPDPLHCYERWLQAEHKVGACSTFFFWPGRCSIGHQHNSDCLYELTDRIGFDGQACTVAEMIREIDRRGWEIGLHPSWYSSHDRTAMRRQKDALEACLGHPIVSVRQHYLHHDIRITPKIQAEAGFLYDSTLGFNDNIGFRFGTSYPWFLYDQQEGHDLPLLEVPLIIQDVAMLNPAKGMRLDEDTAFQYIIQLCTEVENTGGVLTLLWHPNQITQPLSWELYQHTLDYLQEKNAWFSSVRGIGDYWKNRPGRAKDSGTP